MEYLLNTYGNEPWLYDIIQVRDDCGLRLEIQVEGHLYKEDILPRMVMGWGIIVRKVKSGLQ